MFVLPSLANVSLQYSAARSKETKGITGSVISVSPAMCHASNSAITAASLLVLLNACADYGSMSRNESLVEVRKLSLAI